MNPYAQANPLQPSATGADSLPNPNVNPENIDPLSDPEPLMHTKYNLAETNLPENTAAQDRFPTAETKNEAESYPPANPVEEEPVPLETPPPSENKNGFSKKWIFAGLGILIIGLLIGGGFFIYSLLKSEESTTTTTQPEVVTETVPDETEEDEAQTEAADPKTDETAEDTAVAEVDNPETTVEAGIEPSQTPKAETQAVTPALTQSGPGISSVLANLAAAILIFGLLKLGVSKYRERV